MLSISLLTDPFSNIKGIRGMDSEENPKSLCFFIACSDFFQKKELFICSKAAFQFADSFFCNHFG